MSGFKFPGVTWVVLLTALPLLAVWLQEYFPAAIWAAPVAGLLLIVAKVIEVARSAETEPPAGVMAEAAPAPKPSVWWG